MADTFPATKEITYKNTKYTVKLEESGDYFLLSTTGVILAKNGKYLDDSKKNTTLYENNTFTTDAKELFDLTNKTALSIQTGLGGTIKNIKIDSSVNSKTFNTTEGGPVKDLNQTIFENIDGGGVGANTIKPLVDFITNLTKVPNIDEFGTNMEELFKDDKILSYPEDLVTEGQDILVITQYSYKSPYNEIFEGKGRDKIFEDGIQRRSAISTTKKKAIATVMLPIPNNAADTNGVDWGGGNTMNTMSMAAAGDITGILGMYAAQVAGKTFGDLMPGFAGKAASAFGNIPPDILYAIISKSISNPTFRKSLESYLLKTVGYNIPVETILSRGYGVVANSNLELLFSGPTLRGFDFDYSLTPRSDREAKRCRKILRFFKQGMAPKKKTSSGGYGGSSFLLAAPNVFKLSYKTINEDGQIKPIAGLNKFKICALTNMSTSYSEGMWAAYEEGQPARMQMRLSFKELEPVYESDYQETAATTFSTALGDPKEIIDQDAVKRDEIGY